MMNFIKSWQAIKLWNRQLRNTAFYSVILDACSKYRMEKKQKSSQIFSYIATSKKSLFVSKRDYLHKEAIGSAWQDSQGMSKNTKPFERESNF